MGVLLFSVALAALGHGLLNHLELKRLRALPFQKTGEVTPGMVSTQGQVVHPQPPLLSPVSQTACLYYEVAISREWEKLERTPNGNKSVTGSTHLQTLTRGTVFGLDDGSGPVLVDSTRGAQFDTLRQQSKGLGTYYGDGTIRFGELRIPTPHGDSDDYTLGFSAVEKIVPATGTLFVLGKLEAGKLGKPGWRSMLISSRGRDTVLRATSRKQTLSLIGGSLAAMAALALILSPPAAHPPIASPRLEAPLDDARAQPLRDATMLRVAPAAQRNLARAPSH